VVGPTPNCLANLFWYHRIERDSIDIFRYSFHQLA
jgi:hypothetical protein